jgi:hypothetical protein
MQLIVGSDLTYDEECFAPLVRTMVNASTEDTVIIIVLADREEGQVMMITDISFHLRTEHHPPSLHSFPYLDVPASGQSPLSCRVAAQLPTQKVQHRVVNAGAAVPPPPAEQAGGQLGRWARAWARARTGYGCITFMSPATSVTVLLLLLQTWVTICLQSIKKGVYINAITHPLYKLAHGGLWFACIYKLPPSASPVTSRRPRV